MPTVSDSCRPLPAPHHGLRVLACAALEPGAAQQLRLWLPRHPRRRAGGWAAGGWLLELPQRPLLHRDWPRAQGRDHQGLHACVQAHPVWEERFRFETDTADAYI